MLKFELKGRKISLSIREKERRINSLFLSAFAIALLIHVLAYFFFDVEWLGFSGTFVHPPVVVDADITIEDNQETLALLNQKASSKKLFIPPASKPSLPIVYLEKIRTAEMKSEEVVTSFESERPWHLINLDMPMLQDNKIIVIGDLELEDEQLQKLSLLQSIYPQKFSYEIRVDNKTGKIIWFEPKELFTNPPPDEMGQYLLSLNFIHRPKSFVSQGVIEVHIVKEVM